MDLYGPDASRRKGESIDDLEMQDPPYRSENECLMFYAGLPVLRHISMIADTAPPYTTTEAGPEADNLVPGFWQCW